MTINIQAIHFRVNNDLVRFIENKFIKLLKLDKKVISFNVFLKLSKSESYSNKITEIKLKYPGSEFFAKRRCNTFEESTTLVFQALRKQILKKKEKNLFLLG